MNVSILVSSLSFLEKFELLSSLSRWIYQEVVKLKYFDSKFLRSFKKWDYEVSEELIDLVQDKEIFKELRYGFHSGNITNFIDILVSEGMIDKERFLLASLEDNNVEVVQLLLDHSADVHARDDQALRSAGCYGYTEIVRLLLDYGANVHANDNEALINASYYGHIEVVQLLLDYCANVHARDDQALRSASFNGRTEIVQLLLDHSANVHANDNEALKCASLKGNAEIIKLLLDHGSNIHIDDNEPLKYAINSRKVKIVSLLISYGARLN